MSQNNFHIRLKTRREAVGISQKDIANAVGVSTNSVQSWEKDVYPKCDVLVVISEMLKCSIEWLVTGKGEPSPYSDAGQSNVIEIEDTNILKRFVDQPYAAELIRSLVELEKLNPAVFKKVASYIKGVIDGVKSIKHDDYTPGGLNSSGKEKGGIPPGGDRRVIKDRRKEGGT